VSAAAIAPSWASCSMSCLGGQRAVLAFVERELAVVLALAIDADRIRKIHAIADPLKLSFLRAQLSARS